MFEEALGQAQALGYAERNPEADVEGYDACRKIAILTSLVAGKTVDFHKIHTEGIAGIDPTDFAYAKKLDATIKLLALSRETENGYQISVAPYLLKKENALAGVNDVFNAVAVCGNTLGDTMFYGRCRKVADCERGSRRCGGMRETSTENSRMPVGRGRGKSR